MSLTAIWILVSAWCCAAGWVLSAIHELNGPGYLAAFALTIAAAGWSRKAWWPARGFRLPRWPKLRWRFRHLAPFIVLSVALLALLAGLWRAPENGDSNAYRIPRMLHWLAAGHWHWIRTDDSRQNISGCGYEWICAPLFLLNQSERWSCLPNLITYFLLPGLLFSFFRCLKVSGRAAWWWAWLTATGWCYTMQACTTENDAISTVYSLAAVVFSIRARESKSFGHLTIALLAAAVLSAIKPTNLPLLLPCAVALCPSWRLLLQKPVATAALAVLAALASFIPMAILNWRYTGSWKGFVPEQGPVVWWHWGSAFVLPSPFWGVVGNTFYLTAQNLLPPFFPGAAAWNHAMAHFLQTPLGSHFIPFESFGRLNRSVTAGSAGLGLGVVAVVVISLLFIPRRRQMDSRPFRLDFSFFLCLAPWLALLAFMSKVGACQSARYLAAYYPFLLLPLLRRHGMAVLASRRWWQLLVLAIMSCTFALMIFHLGREFVPSSLYARLQAWPKRPAILKILDDNYKTRVSVSAYREFTMHYAAAESLLGYSTIVGGLEPGMWQPWGHGRVERVLPDDTPQWVRSRGIRAIFIEDSGLQARQLTIQQWLALFNATLVDQLAFTTDPGAPLTHLYFCRLNPQSDPAPNAPPAPAAAP